MKSVRISALAVAASLLAVSSASAQILPDNNLYLFDSLDRNANITEAEFGRLTDQALNMWKPIAEIFGGRLVANKLWTDPTVNASADQTGSHWEINMYGGLARRPEVTPDGFSLVVCHELGHHFAGYPFYDFDWAASEGESDYFATQMCGRLLWQNDHAANARFRTTANPVVKAQCDAVWSSEKEQNLCYRMAEGGLSLATLLGKLGSPTAAAPKFDTPDPARVTRTSPRHPAAQCRLDTYLNGALCAKNRDAQVIPGKDHADGQNSVAAERVAGQYSCLTSAGHEVGFRPRCWFKPQVAFDGEVETQ